MSFTDARRLSRRFSTQVPGGDRDELTHEVDADATIEEVEVRFYPGPEQDLELWPFIEPDDGQRFGIVQSNRDGAVIGQNNGGVLVGDDDRDTFHVSEGVEEGWTIGVEYDNREGSHAYDFHVDIELERAGGLSRLVEGVLG